MEESPPQKSIPQNESLASKTVSIEWNAAPEDWQRVLDAAAKGELDRIPIKVADGTVFLSVEAIRVGTGLPGIPAQTWERREQGRLVRTTENKEEGNSR